MRIAQISPLIESVPPKLYGGTERIVSYLTEELVRQGHEVTLFASGDSETAAELVPCAPTALRLAQVTDAQPYTVMQLEKIRRRAGDFDIAHFHSDFFHFPLVRSLGTPSVTTLHGRLDLPFYRMLLDEFPEMPLVSISDDQRRLLSAQWIATVLHGLPKDLYSFSAAGEGGYLAFLGRISPEKRPDRAIEIARRAGVPLKIAAKVDKVDQTYFDETIRPLIQGPGVEYIGEVNDSEKQAFLGGASALLFPIDWPEPFGLVQIEAMACGTPVVAWRRGSVPEVIDEGVSGFMVEDIDEAVDAVHKARSLSRRAVRERFEQRFTIERVAHDYVRVYNSLAAEPILLATGGTPRRGAEVRPLRAPLGRGITMQAAAFAGDRAEETGDDGLTATNLSSHAALEASNTEAVPNPFYISTTTSILESRPRTLKHDDTFAVFDHYGDVSSRGSSAEGVFHKDTRFLSDLRVLVDGQRPLLLSSNVEDNNALLTADLTNPDLFAGGELKLPRDTIQIVRSKFLWAGASYERLGVRSFGAGAQVFEFDVPLRSGLRRYFRASRP